MTVCVLALPALSAAGNAEAPIGPIRQRPSAAVAQIAMWVFRISRPVHCFYKRPGPEFRLHYPCIPKSSLGLIELIKCKWLLRQTYPGGHRPPDRARPPARRAFFI